MRDADLIKSWLQKIASVETLEHASDSKTGRWRDIWLEKVARIKAALAEGGELWSFSSPSQTWANMCGRAGYAVVRDGKVVEAIVTLMN